MGESRPLSDGPEKGPSNLDSDLLKPQNQEEDDLIATFFASTPKVLVPMTLRSPVSEPPEEEVYDRKQFWIRLANTPERREKAALLVDRMYSRGGFEHNDIIWETPHTITLVAYGREGGVIGTISIHFDSPEEGLHSDDGYKPEIDQLRAQGKKICEFNGLAIDPSVRSKLVIARLFHIALLYPSGIFGYTDCIIEVSYSHANFYERLLEFERVADGRLCHRVNAVGVLLHTEFSRINRRLEQVGGLMDQAKGDQSLYPYGFSKSDAEGILGRLKRMV